MRRLAASIALVTLAACSSPASPAASPSASPVETAQPATADVTPAPEATATATPSPSVQPELTFEMATFPVPAGSHPHDVAPAVDGGVWYTAQGSGELGKLYPETGELLEIGLGPRSAPHGVIVGPDDAAWVTDGGLNAIVRVEQGTNVVDAYPLPPGTAPANLNTATFDADGILWFTGQAGIYGSLDPESGAVTVFDAPRGEGPYGISTAPDGGVWYSSLAGSYLGQLDTATGEVTVIDTPTPGGGGRRVWPDSDGRLWVTEWFVGNLAMYDPADDAWTEWRLPGEQPQPYSVYVDETDAVWVTDFGGNALHRFEPLTETFMSFTHESAPADVRQLLGRPGEVWGAESAADQLVVMRFSR